MTNTTQQVDLYFEALALFLGRRVSRSRKRRAGQWAMKVKIEQGRIFSCDVSHVTTTVAM